MAVHWGGRGPGHLSRYTAAGSLSPYTIHGSNLAWWHDPQDLTTLFSDFIGTQANVGDRVQLMLGKSQWQGRTLAQELAQQADVFGAGTATGTAGYQTYTPASDKWVISRDESGSGSFRSDNTLIPQETWLVVEFDFTREGTGPNYAIDIRLSGGTGSIGYSNTSSPSEGRYKVYIKTGSAAGFVYFTMPTTGRSGGFANITVKAIPGAHAYNNSTTSTRPYLRQSAWGAYYLEADGVDDFMVTNALDLSSTDKIAVFTAARKLVDASTAVLMELSADSASNNGSFGLFAPSSSGANSYRFGSKGSATQSVAGTGAFAAAPNTAVLTGLGNISGDSTILRMNGAQVEQSTADQGTGNYGSVYVLNYFRRNATTLPFSGNFWGAFGAKGIPTNTQIAQSEALLNRYAQAY